jgi:hypothetical protein
MKILATVQVPINMSVEEQNRRQSIFDKSVDELCKKYISLGYDIKRGFVFNENIDPYTSLPKQRNLWSFDKSDNLPDEMQKELAILWVALFE